jgi:hypothetical protein
MGTSAIELRPIVGATVSGVAAAAADDDDDDGYRMNNSLEISSIDVDVVSATSLPSSSKSQTLDATVTNKRHVRRKYLSMILVAYVLTLISPGTILWTQFSSSASVSEMCHLSSSNAMSSTSVNTALSDSNKSNGNEADTNYYNNTVKILTHSTNVRGNCVDATISKISIPLLIKLSAYTIVLIGLFLNLQGSNPGLLDKEILSRLEDEDALVVENVNYNDNECIACEDDDERKQSDVERQSFLEPSLQTTTSLMDDDIISSSSTLHRPQQNHPHGYCYPHTRRKYCHTCNIHPPLRSHHCNICQTCVATFDHHCVFLGTCIGERNHFRFWFFVLWNVLCFHLALGIVNSGRTAPQLLGGTKHGGSTSVHVLLALLGYPNDKDEATIKWDSSMARQIRIGQAILVIAKVYMYPLYFIATLLLIIHTINALGNVTTFELSKGPDHIDYLINTKMMDFPFGNGILNNMRIFFNRDDVVSCVCYWWRRLILNRRVYMVDGNRVEHEKETATTSDDDDDDATAWMPTLWKMPRSIDRESEDWWNHPWQNKYWSCC